jgi:5-(carboxyamino)imidazole ribonucleotide synthase
MKATTSIPHTSVTSPAPSAFTPGFRLGILGGGQLGKMLIQSAMDFNLTVHVLDPDPHAPCATYCDEFTIGSLTDFQTVREFGKHVDVLTIEIENVNVDAMERLGSDGITVFPQPQIVRTIQDKGLQKLFLKEHGIPTAGFSLIDATHQLESSTFPAVQKLRTTGYDGRGVLILNSRDDLRRAFDRPSILEQFVPLSKEISVIVARNRRGESVTYPAVEMIFHPEANLVEFLVAPANLAPSVEARARQVATQAAAALGVVGLLAVELFVTNDGDILVNEMAPRPHNSGHHTIEANATSQFEQHLRAILGLPLGSTEPLSPAVMVNVLGGPGSEGPARYEGIEEVLSIEGAHVHLYGKKLTKPFRKMGHVTIVDPTRERALEKARHIKQQLKVVA